MNIFILTAEFLVGVLIVGIHGKGHLSLHSGWQTTRQSLHFKACFENLILRPQGLHFSGRTTVLVTNKWVRLSFPPVL